MADSATDNNSGAHADLAQITDKAELLAQLQEVRVPAVSAWPAPGWWVLGILLIALTLALWLRKKSEQRYATDAWRREALRELNQLSELNKRLPNISDSERHRVVQEASSLLRRVMIHTRGRRDVAGLTGDAWLHALKEFEASGSSSGSDEVGALDKSLYPLVADIPYQPDASELSSASNVKQLLRWLRETIERIPGPTVDTNVTSRAS